MHSVISGHADSRDRIIQENKSESLVRCWYGKLIRCLFKVCAFPPQVSKIDGSEKDVSLVGRFSLLHHKGSTSSVSLLLAAGQTLREAGAGKSGVEVPRTTASGMHRALTHAHSGTISLMTERDAVSAAQKRDVTELHHLMLQIGRPGLDLKNAVRAVLESDSHTHQIYDKVGGARALGLACSLGDLGVVEAVLEAIEREVMHLCTTTIRSDKEKKKGPDDHVKFTFTEEFVAAQTIVDDVVDVLDMYFLGDLDGDRIG